VQLMATTIFGQGVEWKLHAIFPSGSESSVVFALGSESSRERTLQGTKVPPMELSPRERKYVGTKVPVTYQRYIIPSVLLH